MLKPEVILTIEEKPVINKIEEKKPVNQMTEEGKLLDSFINPTNASNIELINLDYRANENIFTKAVKADLNITE